VTEQHDSESFAQRDLCAALSTSEYRVGRTAATRPHPTAARLAACGRHPLHRAPTSEGTRTANRDTRGDRTEPNRINVK